MTLLAPLVLLGLAALAVPLLLHLMKRGEDRTLPFPALRYLRRTAREHARVIRLRQLFLLLLRLGAVALLVMAGARLVLPLGGRDYPPADLVLVVDNGLASGMVVGDARVLDASVRLALLALDRTGPRDRVWVVAAGEPWRPALPGDPESARARLRDLEPTHVTPDLRMSVARAEALLRTGGSELGEVVLVSNLEAGTLRTGGGEPTVDLPVLVVSPEMSHPPNRGVSDVRVHGGLAPRVGEPAEVQVGVVGAEREGATFRLHLGEELLGAGRTDPEGTGVLTLPPLPPGWVAGRVEVEPDNLRADDVRYLAFRVEHPPRVAILGRPPSAVEDALEVLEGAGRLIRAPPGEADLVLSQGGSGLDPERPGPPAVLVAPEDPNLLPAFNEVLQGFRPGWRLEVDGDPSAAAGGRRLEAADPGIRLPGSPEVRQRYTLVVGDGESPGPLLALADGTPWLMDLGVPDRSVLLLASPLTAGASDVPTSAAMIPLMDFLTTLPEGRLRMPEVPAGAPLPLPPEARSVRQPQGTLRSVDGMSLFAETGRAGIYDLVDGEGGLLGRVAVNAEPLAEGRTLTPEEAATRLGPGARGVSAADGWARGVLATRRGREMWRPLAALALLVLLVEGWYAGRGRLRPERAPVVSTGQRR